MSPLSQFWGVLRSGEPVERRSAPYVRSSESSELILIASMFFARNLRFHFLLPTQVHPSKAPYYSITKGAQSALKSQRRSHRLQGWRGPGATKVPASLLRPDDNDYDPPAKLAS